MELETVKKKKNQDLLNKCDEKNSTTDWLVTHYSVCITITIGEWT